MSDPYTVAWLSEMWKPVHELPVDVRADQRKADREARWKLEELDALNTLSTGCAENGAQVRPHGFVKCG